MYILRIRYVHNQTRFSTTRLCNLLGRPVLLLYKHATTTRSFSPNLHSACSDAVTAVRTADAAATPTRSLIIYPKGREVSSAPKPPPFNFSLELGRHCTARTPIESSPATTRPCTPPARRDPSARTRPCCAVDARHTVLRLPAFATACPERRRTNMVPRPAFYPCVPAVCHAWMASCMPCPCCSLAVGRRRHHLNPSLA
jgi:hypothetical protein